MKRETYSETFWTNQRGITLLELLIAAGIMAIMAIFIGNFLLQSYNSNLQIQGAADMGNYSQQTVNRLRLDLSQSMRIFDNTVAGLSYWESAQFQAGFRPVSGTRLPEIVAHGSFSPSNSRDFRNPFVQESAGNALFYAMNMPALETGQTRKIVDLYRFVTYFLQEKNDARFSPRVPTYLDLMQCSSGSYADLGQVRDISDDEVRFKVLEQLKAAGVIALWDTQASAEVAFSEIPGYSPGAKPLVKHRIGMQHCHSIIAGLGRVERPAGVLTYSVAYNKSEAFPIKRQVPLFAQASLSQGIFPNGFEVLVIGPKSGRQVFLRLVLAATINKSILTRESSVIATVKES